MYVREWGRNDGRPLVFWHALGAVQSGAMVTELAPTLTDGGLWLIAPDAPGFGQSLALPPDGYEVESLLKLLEGVLDERGIERALVMGHSWGGTVMSAFAAVRSERVEGLVLIDSGQKDYQEYPDFPHGKSLEDHIAEAADRTLRVPTGEFERSVQDGVRRPVTPAFLEAVRAGVREEESELVSIVTPEVRGAVLHGVTKVRVTDYWPVIAEARIPILLLLATEPEETRMLNEGAVPAFAARFPEAEIHHLEGGHDLIADAAPEVALLVREWAARH